MARLILLQDGKAQTYELTGAENVVGRLPDCEVHLPSNMVSRKHARITKSDGNFLIEDMGSGNGTFVNGQKVENKHSLRHNDRIKFGPLLCRFEADAPAGKEGGGAGPRNAVPVGNVEIQDGGSNSTIVGALDNASGFGMLDVRPQEKLKAILEISRALAGTLDEDKLLPKILDTLFRIFPAADRGCILLKDAKSGQMIPRAMRHRRENEDASVKLSRTILNAVLTDKKAILSADAGSDSRFDASASISALTIRSMMCVPMLNLQGDPIGVINIDTQNPLAQFKSEDLDILVAVAGQAALSYESAQLLQSYVEKQKQDNEMNIARDVQHALLPSELPKIEGYEFHASYDSAQAVGGDYYDVIPTKDGRLWLAFGDVAGKGVPASLVMSRMSSVVRSVSEFVTDASEAMAKINDHMCAKAVEGRFVTFVLMILDPREHKFVVVNAGHMSPMIRKPDGSIEEFGEEMIGLPIGVMEGFVFDQVERSIHPGETVLVYTDGVSEAMDPKNDLYGMDQLRSIVTKGPGNARDLGIAVREDVRRHANGRAQNDDVTLLAFGRTG